MKLQFYRFAKIKIASTSWSIASGELNSIASGELKVQKELGLPHSEVTLVLLVNVLIVSGDISLSEHLKGLTMRVAVLQRLLEILRGSG